MNKSKYIETTKENIPFELFPDEETFQKIFSECLESNAAPTSEAIRNSYQNMSSLFNEFLEAIQENMFRYAYCCGFNAALKVCEKITKTSQNLKSNRYCIKTLHMSSSNLLSI